MGVFSVHYLKPLVIILKGSFKYYVTQKTPIFRDLPTPYITIRNDRPYTYNT